MPSFDHMMTHHFGKTLTALCISFGLLVYAAGYGVWSAAGLVGDAVGVTIEAHDGRTWECYPRG